MLVGVSVKLVEVRTTEHPHGTMFFQLAIYNIYIYILYKYAWCILMSSNMWSAWIRRIRKINRRLDNTRFDLSHVTGLQSTLLAWCSRFPSFNWSNKSSKQFAPVAFRHQKVEFGWVGILTVASGCHPNRMACGRHRTWLPQALGGQMPRSMAVKPDVCDFHPSSRKF